MDRRDFLKICTLSSASYLFSDLRGWALSASSDSAVQRRLIVIFLRGGMDGLNVVVPYGDRHYYDLRPKIALPGPGEELGVLDLDGYFGLHPALQSLLPFWKDKTLAFVHASGSPDPSRSHFDAQDYMETGIPGEKLASSGWLNRLVSELPSNDSHLRALSFGPVIPRIFSGPASIASIANPAASRNMILDKPYVAQLFGEMYGQSHDELSKAFADGMTAHRAINHVLASDLANTSRKNSSNAVSGKNPGSVAPGSAGVPPAYNRGASGPQEVEQIIANRGAPLPKAFNNFGKQLANLINKDHSVQVAFIDFGGWDTHINQGAGSGQLANHLTPLAKGLADLINGLGDLYKHTTIAVMSEFGRTARENGNGGTDHGHGNVMWLLGGGVDGGNVYGRWAGLSSKDLHENRDLPTTTDFRDILAYVLSNQLEISDASIGKIFPNFKANPKDVLVKG